MSLYTIGIDPGATGAIAAVDGDGAVAIRAVARGDVTGVYDNVKVNE